MVSSNGLVTERSAPGRRSFAELHRDVWRVVKLAPWVFLVLPALAWLPVDFAVEFFLGRMNLDAWNELRYSIKIESFASWTIGTLVTAFQLAAVGLIAQGLCVSRNQVTRRGFADWSRLAGVFFSAGWRIGIATLLLIVPGIYLMVRYALAMPVAVFEQKRGAAALKTSAEYVKGASWRVFFCGLGALFLYLPFFFVPFLVAPESSPFWISVATVPTNVLVSLITVGMTLIYAERRTDWDAREPVGLSLEPVPVGVAELTRPGRRTIWLVGLLGYATGIAVFAGVIVVQTRMEAAADADYEAGRFESSLAKFERLDAWKPDDPYTLYSIGWNHMMLDNPEAAEPYFARTLELAPGEPGVALEYARLLLDLDRPGEAMQWVSKADEWGHPAPDEVADVRRSILTHMRGGETAGQ